jgi:hypothetical protein
VVKLKNTTGEMMINKMINYIKILEAKAIILLITPLPIQALLILGNRFKLRNFPGHPENYDHGNLAMVLRPENKKSDVEYASMTFPYWDPDPDMAHEVKP